VEAAATAALERLWPGRAARCEPLTGGITNRNYRVDVDGASYVLRIGGNDTRLLGIDRAVEHAASLRAAEVGVGPEVVAFVEPEGWLITRFIEATPLPAEELRRPDNIARVAAALRSIHAAAPIPGSFDAHGVVDDYRRVAEEQGVLLPPAFASSRAWAERIRTARGPQPVVPCHNDLLNANFLDDGRVRIVDWEYAGMGDRFFDLANLSVNHDFGVEEDRLLLTAYFGEARPAALASLRLMRFMSDFREAMWGVVQSGISELDFDFDGYAAEHFERMSRAAAEPAFETSLAGFA
jgi:thiamine kinase-like enzyme